jgi:2-iminobutanoate/2-iminopropanoate deaminase
MKQLRVIPALFLITVTLAAQSSSTVRYVNPSEVFHPPGYSPAVVVNGGRVVYVSGQVGLNTHVDLVGKDDFRAQTTQVFENLKAVLVAAGTTPAHLIKLNYFVVGLDDSKLQAMREIRDRYIDKSHPPASTLAGVQTLFRKDVQIEIEAIASVP